MMSFGAFWVVFFTVQLPVLHAKWYNLVPFPIFYFFSLQIKSGLNKRKLNKTVVVTHPKSSVCQLTDWKISNHNSGTTCYNNIVVIITVNKVEYLKQEI